MNGWVAGLWLVCGAVLLAQEKPQGAGSEILRIRQDLTPSKEVPGVLVAKDGTTGTAKEFADRELLKLVTGYVTQRNNDTLRHCLDVYLLISGQDADFLPHLEPLLSLDMVRFIEVWRSLPEDNRVLLSAHLKALQRIYGIAVPREVLPDALPSQ